jgi:integrase/recombinase XerD
MNDFNELQPYTDLPSADLAPRRRVGPSPVDVFLAGYAAHNTRRTYLEGLQRCASVAGVPFERMLWERLEFVHTSAIRAKLLERYSPKTVKDALGALKGLLRTCWRMRLMSHEAFAQATEWPKTRHARVPAGRLLSDEDQRSIAAWARGQRGAYGAWLRAVLAVLGGCGLRAAELSSALFTNYDGPGKTLLVLRKGAKPDAVPLGDAQVVAIDAWLPFRSSRQPYLFHHVHRTGPGVRPHGVGLRPVTTSDLDWTCRLIARKTNLAHFSAHDFRRTFCTTTLDKGVDLLLTKRLMGHESVTTTQIYDRREQTKTIEARARMSYAIEEVVVQPKEEEKDWTKRNIPGF